MHIYTLTGLLFHFWGNIFLPTSLLLLSLLISMRAVEECALDTQPAAGSPGCAIHVGAAWATFGGIGSKTKSSWGVLVTIHPQLHRWYVDQQLLLSREEAVPSTLSSRDPGLMRHNPFSFHSFWRQLIKLKHLLPLSSPFSPVTSYLFNNVLGGEVFKNKILVSPLNYFNLWSIIWLEQWMWQVYVYHDLLLSIFIFLGSKITADGDCSHEIRRRLLLGRKAKTAC